MNFCGYILSIMRLSVIGSALLNLRIYTRAVVAVIMDCSVVMITPSV